MTNLDTHNTGSQLAALRSAARHSAHVHHAKTMLVASSLAAMTVIAVAATLLIQIF